MITADKIDAFGTSMLVVLLALAVLMVVVCCSSGCCANDTQSEELKAGIVDACYTVLEYNPSDADERVNKYLEGKVESKEITVEERRMIERCTRRTVTSKRWGKQ